MKKKILLGLLVFVALFTITGCGKKYSLGDTVKTNIISFKLTAGEFTYALVNTIGDEYGMPKEYNDEVDNKNPYVAAKGHTLAAFTFYIENLDRSSINIGGSFNSKFGSITYDKKNYEDNNDSVVKFISTLDDNLNWESYSSGNILLQAGEKKYFRAYIDISSDVKSLDDTMELTIYLPTSEDKTEAFTFVISEDNRNNYKGEEISKDVAIKNLKKKVAQEYFNSHLNEYSSITGDEIKSYIEGKKFYATILDSGTWQGTFTFETSGRIYEGINKYADGYPNNRTWNISENNLNLSSVNSKGKTKTTSYEIKKVKDGVYLLVVDNKVSGILY